VTNPRASKPADKDTQAPASQGDDATPTQDGASAAKEQVAEPAPAGKQGGPSTKAGGKAGAKSGAKAKRSVLKVRALGERFRRAGMSFGPRETVLYVDDLSADQIKALKAEPRLSVVEGQVDEATENGAKE